MLKQYIERIFTDLHLRITSTHHEEQQPDECTVDTSVVVVAVNDS